ncbi:MAG: MFS transporter [Deltaproteobacteria bacterium]|nr:MFS transporter [Deltaproteobacteria bacterium]
MDLVGGRALSSLAVGTLALFVVSLGYGVIVPLLPQLAGGRAATDETMLSAVYASYAITKIAMQIPGGVWADRFGPERVARWALVVFGVSLAAFLLPLGLESFTLWRALEGAATGLVYPACFAIAARGEPGAPKDDEHMGRRMGFLGAIGTSGLLVGPALGGLLGEATELGPKLPLLVALGATVVVTLLLFVRPSPPPTRAVEKTPAEAFREIGALLKSGLFIALMLPIAFNKLTFSAFQGLLPLVGPDHLGLDVGGVTALFVVTGLAFGLAQPIAGALADRVDPRRVANAFALPLLGSLVAMGFLTNGWAFGAAYAGYIGSSSVIFTATLKHAATSTGDERSYGGVFGVFGTATDLMTVVGPLLFLNLYPAMGLSLFWAMAAIGVPFAFAYAFLTRPRAHS